MEPGLREQVTFHLTGRSRAATGWPAAASGLRPAAMAGLADLGALRYDYPLILVDKSVGPACVRSLSGVFDELQSAAATGPEADRVRHHALRLEREIRRCQDAGRPRTLTALWSLAERRLGAPADATLADSLARLSAALRVDGDVVDCDRDLPARLIRHAWAAAARQKARRMRAALERSMLKLGEILAAHEAHSGAGLSAERLRASIGPAFDGTIDFGAMSRLLTTSRPAAPLPESRRQRIQRLLATLESQAFFPAPERAAAATAAPAAYEFVFERCSQAIEAYRERLPRLVELAGALLAASLEIDGSYREPTHDRIFAAFGADQLGPTELGQFPDYLVCLDADVLDPAEADALLEALAAGMPLKVLLATHDLTAPPQVDLDAPAGWRARQLAHAAIGLGGVHVQQVAASQLYRSRERICRGLEYAGPALLSVYSGAGGALGGLPPYLAAAAAAESRAFPSFSYEPSAGPDWASRFSLEPNSQPELDHPVCELSYEDEGLQRVQAAWPFTLADFLACDARQAGSFAPVTRAAWSAEMVPVAAALDLEPAALPGPVPYVPMVDGQGVLRRFIVHARVLREVRRCRDRWHSLQELGGIHNSHAERLLARERQAWEDEARKQAAAAPAAAVPVSAPASAPATAPAPAPPAATRHPDEAYIETARCSTCNECTRINDRMFKYDANRQAYIADIDAGTFAQLVEAAESCQVAIIHPGKPRNPAEHNLDALLARAAKFP